MPSRYKRPLTLAERERREQAHADKLAGLHERLAEQVAALRTGEDWRAWLDVASRFHTYSFNNTLLIASQRPDATLVASYEAWKALGRQVEKGERGIQILAPIVRRPAADAAAGADSGAEDERSQLTPGSAPSGADTPDNEERRRRVTGFRVTYVWDLSQTSGEPLPERPRPQLLSGQAPPGLWDSLAQLAADRGFTLQRGDCGAANGWTDYLTRTVRVRGDVDDTQAVKTLAHELGHVLLHDPSDAANTSSPGVPRTASTTVSCRGVQEVEAESVTYLVAAAHGLSTDDYTFAYVTGWASSSDRSGPEQVVRDTGARVLAATRTVLAVTDPDIGATAEPSLAARAHAGAERAAGARNSAEATATLAAEPAPAAPAADLDALARLHADAAAFYTAQLRADTPEAARARALLEHRAVPPEAVADFELGYAPPTWTALSDHLRGRGWTDEQLLAAGVGMTTRRGTVVDRFRDRVMLPIREPVGERVVAVLGRAVGSSEGTPKYLNSPETALYRKGDVLYGLGAEPGRSAVAAGARPVLVEGALDAIAVTCAGGGRYVGVAASGTALTAAQVAVLAAAAGPLVDRGVTVAFDSDSAGREAALRAYPLLRAAGGWPTMIDLPDGQDPAGVVQHAGQGALRAALTAERPLADLLVDDRVDRWADRLRWIAGRVGAVHDAAQLVATLPPEHVRRQVIRVAERLDLDHATVTDAVVDAFTRDADAPGRLARRDRRDDLDRGQALTGTATPARLARAGFPAPLRDTPPRVATVPAPAVADPSAPSLRRVAGRAR